MILWLDEQLIIFKFCGRHMKIDKRKAYEIMGIDPDTTQEEGKKIYRKLAKQMHPDRNPGDKRAEEKFKALKDAWDALKDILPKKKLPDLVGLKGEALDAAAAEIYASGAPSSAGSTGIVRRQ